MARRKDPNSDIYDNNKKTESGELIYDPDTQRQVKALLSGKQKIHPLKINAQHFKLDKGK